MFLEKNLLKSVLLPDGGDRRAFCWLANSSRLSSVAVCGILLTTFEIWARFGYNATFVFILPNSVIAAIQ
jgi:hypothetical protein